MVRRFRRNAEARLSTSARRVFQNSVLRHQRDSAWKLLRVFEGLRRLGQPQISTESEKFPFSRRVCSGLARPNVCKTCRWPRRSRGRHTRHHTRAAEVGRFFGSTRYRSEGNCGDRAAFSRTSFARRSLRPGSVHAQKLELLATFGSAQREIPEQRQSARKVARRA